jgi:hypothetical protein
MPAPTSRTRRPFVLAEAVTLLSKTPGTLDALLRTLPDDWLAAHEGGETWSPHDIVGHLIHGERTDWLPRARIIMEHGETQAFEPYDRFAQFAEGNRPLADMLDDFAALRARNLRDLAALAITPADLERRGRHPDFGPVTLSQLLATWVAHDLDHVIQIARVLANQYSDAVGPWRRYLRVISGQQG